MKTITFFALALIASLSAHAQWTDSGSNTTTTDKIGIGTTEPLERLQIGTSGFTFHDGGHKVIGFGFAAWPFTDLSSSSYEGEIRFDMAKGSLHLGVGSNDGNYPSRDFNISNNGNIGIGISSPAEKLHVNGSIRGNAGGGALRVQTSSGYMDVGAQNASWAHIYTDRPKIIFNKDVYTISNAFSSYNNDLILKTEGTERLRINDDTGNVGIGATNPTSKLQVVGDIKLDDKITFDNGDMLSTIGYTGDETDFNITTSADDLNIYSGTSIQNRTAEYFITSDYFSFRGDEFSINSDEDVSFHGTGAFHVRNADEINMATGNDLAINAGQGVNIQAETFSVQAESYFANNVGIGTPNPKNKLSVNGTIWAKEVKVSLTDAADWVFEEDYNLRPLEEVAAYIKENKHLPEIPSAEEFRQNDMKVSEMTNKLLQKIEELTLYILQQEERIKVLEQTAQKN
ncbi:hypothetical protein [Aquimarina pacifica]|uniref:hypothetical protein n=1 Tax=Aquimarina pacifica TaxID=1296415 RepID=UPI0004717BC8|nr:hypothetical protein [Aquimarina pacifica]